MGSSQKQHPGRIICCSTAHAKCGLPESNGVARVSRLLSWTFDGGVDVEVRRPTDTEVTDADLPIQDHLLCAFSCRIKNYRPRFRP